MRFKPVYGFGWFLSDANQSIDVPEEFTLDIQQMDESVILGIVESPHSLSGKKIELTLRTVSNGIKNYNVRVFDSTPNPEITGFAEAIG